MMSDWFCFAKASALILVITQSPLLVIISEPAKLFSAFDRF